MTPRASTGGLRVSSNAERSTEIARDRSPTPAYARPSDSCRPGRRRAEALGSSSRACSKSATARSSSRWSMASCPIPSIARLSACMSPHARASSASVCSDSAASSAPIRTAISARPMRAGRIVPPAARPASSAVVTPSRRASSARMRGDGTRSPASIRQMYAGEHPGNASCFIDRPRSARTARSRRPSDDGSSTCVGAGRPTVHSITCNGGSVDAN